MANTRAQNTYYVDTQYSSSEELAGKYNVTAVVVTATGANGRLVLTDSGTSKADLRVATSGDTKIFEFPFLTPMRFETSIRPTTLSNAVATVFFKAE